jgi:hypothetical protein
MPHYKDGSEVHIGDHVTGHLINTPGQSAGTVVSITPSSAGACNAKVRFFVAKETGDVNAIPPAPSSARGEPTIKRGHNHGQDGPIVVVWECEDYCDTPELTKVTLDPHHPKAPQSA